ncbi:MAG TPA: RNA-binding protein [Roseiarcus sp.]|nr:RNA-binding protein [Roseiarcus sp.]
MRTSDRAGSERTCIVTGMKDVPEAMLRFALSPDGSVVPDIRRKLPGRGVWTRLSFETVRRAAVKQAFSRAFRARAAAPASLAEAVDALLERDALQALSIANKAGLALAGAFKVDSAIEAGQIAALIQASDGAADGAAKRARALRANLGPAAEAVARVDLFTSGQLDLALGRANVIHAALKHGAASSAFLARADRLRRYREGEADAASGNVRGGETADKARTVGGPVNLAEKPSG